MPFAMIHLNIALNIMEKTDLIQNKGEFLLGALSPDAVHYRANYESLMKFNSHLCVGNETWGNITNNEEWETNVLLYLKENENSKYLDFIRGYCCHILSDIQNNRKVWTPFKEKIRNLSIPGIWKKYHEESNVVDYHLYLASNKYLFDLLEMSEGSSLMNLVTKEEIQQLKDDLLNIRFKDRIKEDLSKHEYVHLNEMEKFISEEALYIYKLLFQSITD
ncbi:MAG: zinc dependent phospholipase C family protein [Clostridia bacterium]|nr:zinc dependent phospholipase C family protein [Clostridia bacterium]